MSWKIHQLPYAVPPLEWLGRVRHLSYPFLLASGDKAGQRYDFVGAAPSATVTVSDGKTLVTAGGTPSAAEDPFAAIESLMSSSAPGSPCPIDIPFTGGAVGSFGYELAYRLERIGAAPPRETSLPEMDVGIYNWFIVRDSKAQTCHLIATPDVSETIWQELKALLDQRGLTPGAATPGASTLGASTPGAAAPGASTPGTFQLTSKIVSSFTRQEYNEAVNRILGYIRAGDCYQVNLTQRFEAAFEGDPLGLYAAIASAQKAPYGACLLFPRGQILSFSPERFLLVDDRNHVVTQPIKGTRPRGLTPSADDALARELENSEKDRAENLMIVDLLRNDLGRCSKTGSVRALRLFELQSFENVHHLVSTVVSDLAADVTPLELLKRCFPGGSITGAPKVRAMQIIAELEPVRRESYCGAIGYYSYSGHLDTNLPIRTLVCSDGRVRYWGGGGIVADSTPDGEYDESLAKVDFIRAALEQPHRSAPAARHSR